MQVGIGAFVYLRRIFEDLISAARVQAATAQEWDQEAFERGRMDEKILALYAKGMSVRDVQRHLEDLYQVEVSPSLISEVTDAVWEDIQQWQSRPLEPPAKYVALLLLVLASRFQGRLPRRF